MVAALGAALLLAACGGSNDANVTVGTSASMGSVGGVVLEAGPDLAPIAGVAVTVLAGGTPFATTTDAAGTFAVRGVPSGTVIVKLSAADHYDVYVTGSLASSAGNFPVSNAALTVGPIAMVGKKGTFALRLVDDVGAPAGGVKVTARIAAAWLDLASGNATPRGVVDVTATSTGDGTVTLGNLPDFANVGALLGATPLTVSIPPAKVSGTATYQFLGFVGDFYPSDLRSGQGQGQLTPTIVLAGPHTPLTVLSSNLDWLVTNTAGPTGPLVSANGPITVTFNQAVAPASLRAQLYADLGAATAVMVTPTVNFNVVKLDFMPALSPATRYNLQLHAVSAAAQAKEYNVLAPLFTPPDKSKPVAVMAFPDPVGSGSSDVILTFSEPVGLGSGFSSSSNLPCVVFYEAKLSGMSGISPGEWSSQGNDALKCQPTGGPPGIYMRPDETNAGASQMPVTGFSKTWRIAYKQACYGMYLCGGDINNKPTVHLQFSRNTTPGQAMKRVDGTPVPDLTVTVPPI